MRVGLFVRGWVVAVPSVVVAVRCHLKWSADKARGNAKKFLFLAVVADVIRSWIMVFLRGKEIYSTV